MTRLQKFKDWLIITFNREQLEVALEYYKVKLAYARTIIECIEEILSSQILNDN